MKKTILALMLVVGLFSFNSTQQQSLKVEGVVQEWQNVINVMEQSNARHLEVEAAKKFIITQLNQQLDTTNKKK